MKGMNGREIKKGRTVLYLDHNVDEWVTAKVTGFDEKDGDPIVIVKLRNGDDRWGRPEQIDA